MAPTPPTTKRGMIITGTDTTNLRLDVSDVIDQLSPEEVPLLDLIGKDSLATPCEQLKHEWLEDQLRPRGGTLGAAYTAGSSSMQFAAGQGAYLLAEDLILVGNAVYRVVAGPPDSDIAVVAVIGTTTDANVASGAIWTKLAQASPEAGTARTDASKTVVGRPFNYTQIFKDWALVSGSMQAIRRYGYVSEWSYQIEKVLKQLAIDMELSLIYGAKSNVDGPPRRSTMGGLYEYIYLAGVANSWSTVVNANGAQLDETMLNNLLQAIWEAGGMPETVLVNGFNKRQINRWASPRIRTLQDERTAGNYITSYESEFGTLDILKDRWLRKGDVVILTKGEIGIGPLTSRQFSSRELPSTGDYTWWEILGEYTMEVHKPSVAHGWIYNSATA